MDGAEVRNVTVEVELVCNDRHSTGLFKKKFNQIWNDENEGKTRIKKSLNASSG